MIAFKIILEFKGNTLRSPIRFLPDLIRLSQWQVSEIGFEEFLLI
jgi:hypothetical protein